MQRLRRLYGPQLVDGKWVEGDVAAAEMRNGAFHRGPTRRTFTSSAGPSGLSHLLSMQIFEGPQKSPIDKPANAAKLMEVLMDRSPSGWPDDIP
jgi:hypothetical protein